MNRAARYIALAIVLLINGSGCSERSRMSATLSPKETSVPANDSTKKPSNFDATLADLTANRPTVESADEPVDEDAVRVIDDAAIAMGGPDAYKAMSRGHIKMKIIGDLPDFTKPLGSKTVDAEIYYQLPKYDRREIRSDKVKDSLVLITNSGQAWSGNQRMEGSKIQPNSTEIEHGPFVIGMIQTYFETIPPGLKLRKDLPARALPATQCSNCGCVGLEEMRKR